MYKSKLQIMCQLRKWELPEYTPALKQGPDHNPRFTSTVNVNGVVFSSAEPCRSSKEAQNDAAKVAFDHFNEHVATNSPPAPAPAPPPVPAVKNAFEHLIWTPPSLPVAAHKATPSGLIPTSPSDFHAGLSIGRPVVNISPSESKDNQNFMDSHVGSCIGGASTQMNGSLSQVQDSKKFIDSAHLYKNRLQNYALKNNIPLPAYSCEREGPPHVPRFRCKVTFQGKTAESSEFYSTIKEAEQAAAKHAWESWSLDEVQQDDTALYKNMLQECLQGKGYTLPKYETTASGPPHMPIFVSKINIGGHVYEGSAARSKKQAESQAAKVAYFGLQDHLKVAEQSETCREPNLERHPDFGYGYQIKEALEMSSSILQSVIAKSGLPPKVTPNANLQIPVEISEEYADSTNEVPPSSPETGNSVKRLCLPSSDLFDGDSLGFSSITTNNVLQQVGSTATKNTTNETIVVRPRVPNMKFSAGATVLPFSDDKWVAVKMNSNQ